MKQTRLFIGQLIKMMANKLQGDNKVFYNNLPTNVKAFAFNNFRGLSIAFIEKEDEAYTLTLSDDSKITVNQDGSWQKIDCSQESVLMSLLPARITANISNVFDDAKIVRAEKNAEGYVVELTNTVCMKYDCQGLAA
ncbi:MAG: PepSY-like domain-containing protein [Prevotella sp.]|nr:PepSY-like domain-containing protein [Prevotella sp.]